MTAGDLAAILNEYADKKSIIGEYVTFKLCQLSLSSKAVMIAMMA